MEKEILLLSGKGKLPLLFKELSQREGYRTYTVGVKTITDFKTDYTIPFLGFTEFEQLLREFKNPHIVMLGKFEPSLTVALLDSLWQKLRLKIFGGSNWERNWKIFLSLRGRVKTTLPGEVVKVFIDYLEERDFKFLPSEEIRRILNPLFAEKGNLTPRLEIEEPLFREGKRFLEYAKRLADMEIGQTVVFKGGHIFAVEAAEGTDNTIKRGAKLAGRGFSVAKAGRKTQDYRIDIPAVGLETLKLLKRYGARTLFLEAGKVLIVQKGEFLKEATRSNIAVVAL